MSERKIPGGLKDETGAYIKLPKPVAVEEAPYTEPLRHDVSLDDLLSRCMLVLWREVYNLQEATSGGSKLTKEQALELRENTRLLMELKKKEKDLLDGLSDEELADLASVQSGGGKSNSKTRKAKKPA